jgi:hypothetical protein
MYLVELANIFPVLFIGLTLLPSSLSFLRSSILYLVANLLSLSLSNLSKIVAPTFYADVSKAAGLLVFDF